MDAPLYNGGMVRAACAMILMVLVPLAASAQTPRPFPGAAAQPQQPQPAVPPAPAAPAGAATTPPPAPTGAGPTTQTLGIAVYPAARFLASYDAGRGQRYYLFGTAASFTDIVAYYRTQLNERGTLVYKEPLTHMFDVGRFREETMAFPPGVTVKDWTSGGSQGYPNPTPGEQPARFPTVIMIVPAPAATPAGR